MIALALALALSSTTPAFHAVVLGAEGGLEDGDLSAYLLRSSKAHKYLLLDAGTVVHGIESARAKGAFPDVDKALAPNAASGVILREQVGAVLLSHAHFDHTAGLVIASPDDSKRMILGLPSTIDALRDHVFNGSVWANFGDDGPGALSRYHYVRMTSGAAVKLVDESVDVTAFPLSHGGATSTAFLVDSGDATVAYLGDTGPDDVEHATSLTQLFAHLTPLVRGHKLAAIFMESSYASAREDKLLFGHMTPKHVLAALHAFARDVDLAHPDKALAGLTVVITHIKPVLTPGPSPRDTIADELNKGNDMGIRFVIPKQGDALDLSPPVTDVCYGPRHMTLSLPFAFLVASATPALPPDVLLQQTLVVSLGGQEVGTIDALDKKVPGGVELKRTTKLKVKRGATENDMTTVTTVKLDAEQKPVSYRYERIDASGTLTTEGKIVGDKLLLTSTQNGSSVQNSLDVKPGTSFSLALEHETRDHLADGTVLDRPVIIEEMGAPVDMHIVEKKKPDGGFVVASTFMNLETDEEMNAKGETLVARTPSMGIVAYPPGMAPSDLVRGTSDLLQLSQWTTQAVRPPVARVLYRVTAPDAPTFLVPEDLRQKIVKRDASTITIEVKAGDTDTGKLSADRRTKLLSATPYEEVNDPRIKKTADDAVKGAKSKREEVAKLTSFVYGYVQNKSLDRGYAPAVSTLDSKTGDCTEHSVLLSALLRSRGIPTRLIDGVIIDGTHAGYHEWVEAYVDGEGFVPADPTFNQFPAGPERLKLAEGSTMPDEHMQLSLAAARLLKPGVKIEVLESTPAAVK